LCDIFSRYAVRKAFNRMLDAAELDRRGPHQMRHTFAFLLLQDSTPITYVSRQLGPTDLSITLRVYSHWLPDNSLAKLVDVLDDAAPRGPQTAPTTSETEVQKAVSGLESVVSRIFASWHQLGGWLRRVEMLRQQAA
jgi:integrase-like protein